MVLYPCKLLNKQSYSGSWFGTARPNFSLVDLWQDLGHEKHCAEWRSLCVDLHQSEASWLTSLIAIEILHCASQYERRIHQATSAYPFKILLLVKSRPTKPCRIRQQIASEILRSDDKKLHHVPRKMKHLYGPDLAVAVESGTLGFRLACALMEIRRVWKSDVRDCERINKLLTCISERCPNANLELLSARATIKHHLGSTVAGPETHRKKWSTLKPVATDLLNQCIAAWDDKTDVISNPDRWSCPDPVPAMSSQEFLFFCRCVFF